MKVDYDVMAEQKFKAEREDIIVEVLKSMLVEQSNARTNARLGVIQEGRERFLNGCDTMSSDDLVIWHRSVKAGDIPDAGFFGEDDERK